MIRTQIYLPESLHKSVHFLAKRRGVKASQLIRELLEEGIRKMREEERGGIDFLFKLTKYKAKAPKDLSKSIDKYVYRS